jgi:hypothetical protein
MKTAGGEFQDQFRLVPVCTLHALSLLKMRSIHLSEFAAFVGLQMTLKSQRPFLIGDFKLGDVLVCTNFRVLRAQTV